MNEALHDLLEVMDGRGWMTGAELKSLMPMTTSQLRDRLVRLERKGLVEKRLCGSMVQPHAEWRRTGTAIPPVDSRARALLRERLTESWQSTKDLSEASGVARSYTLQVLKKMQNDGLVASCRITQGKHMATAWRLEP